MPPKRTASAPAGGGDILPLSTLDQPAPARVKRAKTTHVQWAADVDANERTRRVWVIRHVHADGISECVFDRQTDAFKLWNVLYKVATNGNRVPMMHGSGFAAPTPVSLADLNGGARDAWDEPPERISPAEMKVRARAVYYLCLQVEQQQFYGVFSTQEAAQACRGEMLRRSPFVFIPVEGWRLLCEFSSDLRACAGDDVAMTTAARGWIADAHNRKYQPSE